LCRYDEDANANLNPLWLREVLDIGLSILNSLQYLHNTVTHGDISSSNVLVKMAVNPKQIKAMSVVLADFETACVWDTPYCQLPRTHQDSGEPEWPRGTAAFMLPLEDEAEMQRQGMSDQKRHQARHGGCVLCPVPCVLFFRPFVI
jgi:serine/threonine protein kinase